MNPTIEATKADHVPPDAAVCHYDELIGEAKHVLPDAVAKGSATVPWRAAEQFATIDIVKFTSYYRVTLTKLQETPASSHASSRDARSWSDSTTPSHELLESDMELVESGSEL